MGKYEIPLPDFLLLCLKHSKLENTDFVKIAEEGGFKSKKAAYKHLWDIRNRQQKSSTKTTSNTTDDSEPASPTTPTRNKMNTGCVQKSVSPKRKRTGRVTAKNINYAFKEEIDKKLYAN